MIYYKKFIRIIQQWVFIWTKPGYCVNKVEYSISKRLFYNYKIFDDLIECVQGHVEVNEYNYVFYLRIELHHFDGHTNSSHEGTTTGLKFCAGAVVPVNNFDIKITKLCSQATRKTEMRIQITEKEVAYSKAW